jgi:glycosyltransferase involved in cell wall biosynthesis
MNKVLIVASVASMIDQFNRDNIKILLDIGCEVHVGANFKFGSTSNQSRVNQFRQELIEMNVSVFDFPFPRKIGSFFENIIVYNIVKNHIRENNYQIIHVHSPIGGFIVRLAALKYRGKGLKVIYTAHGFHFFKGAPLLNWLIFYPLEKILSFFTDVLITINTEDFNRAKSFYSKNTMYIPGVGVDTKKFSNTLVDIEFKKKAMGIPDDSFILLSVGELCKRKNHKIIIKALPYVSKKTYYIICGLGSEEKKLKKLSNHLGVGERVLFLGFRNDINEIIKISDCFAFPSKREGLGIAAIEAMAAGLPIITSNVNGILDYSKDGLTGFVCEPTDKDAFTIAIQKLSEDEILRENIRDYNLKRVKDFDISVVNKIMESLYSSVVNMNLISEN